MAKTFARIQFHLVFSTAYRRKALSKNIRPDLYGNIAHTITARGGRLHAIGGVEDHLHIHLEIPVNQRPCDMVAAIKANSSAWIRKRPGGDRHFRWQKGYSLFSVCATHTEALRAYIERQEEHHSSTTAAKEMARILERHSIDFVMEKLEADGWFV